MYRTLTGNRASVTLTAGYRWSFDTLFFELQNSDSLVNVTSWVHGRHTFKFGGEARLIRTDNLQPNPGATLWRFQPIFTDQRGVPNTGFDYASFLLGLPAQGASCTLQFTLAAAQAVDLLIPAGTLIGTQDGAFVFAAQADLTG